MSGSRTWMFRTLWMLTIALAPLAGLEAQSYEEPLEPPVEELAFGAGDEAAVEPEAAPAAGGETAGGSEVAPAATLTTPPAGEPGVELDEVRHAALLFTGGSGGTYLPAPVLDTEYEIRVTGMIVRARVTQRFVNPGRGFLDGLYVFPLPESAAVDRLLMTIGDRQIEGRIQERGQAETTYRQARSEGKKASLVRQHRPNLFTTAVANIGPAEEIVVQLEYQEAARYDAGDFRLRVPLAITPRFSPPPSGRAVFADGRPGPGSAVFALAGIEPDPVPPGPGLAGGVGQSMRRVRLSIDLDAGVPLARLESSYHEILDVAAGPGRYLVTLAQPSVPADRDFELVWTPEIGRVPKAAAFTENVDGEWYSLLMVLPPPTSTAAGVRLPRDVVFVIDTSGSMKGHSIEQAKQALLWALDRLEPQDRFNIIRFDSSTDQLFGTSLDVGTNSLEQARRYVAGLEADGGTVALRAIEAALAEQPPAGMLRQVVFITDGAVGNENECFFFIKQNLGRSRLFTVGIGGAPNSHFMTRAARFGRGTFTHVGKSEEVAQKMAALFGKLESPVLTDIEVRFDDPTAELLPERWSDLYAGEPLVSVARLGRLGGAVELTGRLDGSQWQESLTPPRGIETRGIDKLWARGKIDLLLESLHFGADPDSTRQAVTELALRHHLVSRYTSLVAVDTQQTAPARAATSASQQPLALPQTATPAALLRIAGAALMLLSVALLAMRRRLE